MTDPMLNNMIKVEVLYALPHEQTLLSVEVPPGSTLGDAIKISGILAKHAEIDLATNKVGIFGKLSKPDTVLRERDRIEIYRPLIADPKEIRKKRAEEGKVMKKGGGDA
jgi:uncharacterized protein